MTATRGKPGPVTAICKNRFKTGSYRIDISFETNSRRDRDVCVGAEKILTRKLFRQKVSLRRENRSSGFGETIRRRVIRKFKLFIACVIDFVPGGKPNCSNHDIFVLNSVLVIHRTLHGGSNAEFI